MRSPFFRLSALGVALLSVAAVGLLLNIPPNASGADLVRVDVLVALMMAAVAIHFVTVRLVRQRAWPHQTIAASDWETPYVHYDCPEGPALVRSQG
jgi:hypothetical protein